VLCTNWGIQNLVAVVGRAAAVRHVHPQRFRHDSPRCVIGAMDPANLKRSEWKARIDNTGLRLSIYLLRRLPRQCPGCDWFTIATCAYAGRRIWISCWPSPLAAGFTASKSWRCSGRTKGPEAAAKWRASREPRA
jgi:hypothetical protein